MAVGGTSSTPIFVKDGQYLSMVADADITLGNVVIITATGTDTCTFSAEPEESLVAGVAVSGNRFSRTGTANVVKAGDRVTVCTRGVVRVYTGTSAILRGSALEAGASGIVDLAGTYGSGSGHASSVVGWALDANSSAATTIRMLLKRG